MRIMISHPDLVNTFLAKNLDIFYKITLVIVFTTKNPSTFVNGF